MSPCWAWPRDKRSLTRISHPRETEWYGREYRGSYSGFRQEVKRFPGSWRIAPANTYERRWFIMITVHCTRPLVNNASFPLSLEITPCRKISPRISPKIQHKLPLWKGARIRLSLRETWNRFDGLSRKAYCQVLRTRVNITSRATLYSEDAEMVNRFPSSQQQTWLIYCLM